MRIPVVLTFGMLLGLLFTLPPRALSQEQTKTSSLQVHVNYTGSGTVDDKHKVYVVLWDSPAFVEGGDSAPLELKTTTSKQGVVIFSAINKTPVYISVVFDPTGEWDGQSGPPSEGSILGLYSKTPGKPATIDLTPGKPTKIELTFDDTVKMQSGKPAQ